MASSNAEPRPDRKRRKGAGSAVEAAKNIKKETWGPLRGWETGVGETAPLVREEGVTHYSASPAPPNLHPVTSSECVESQGQPLGGSARCSTLASFAASI